MRISGVDCKLPSNKIDNEEILDRVKFSSKNCSRQQKEEIVVKLRVLLEKSGIESRYWRLKNERPLDLICNSLQENLKRNNISKDSIHTIIYVSVDRGFIEPSNASILANELELPAVRAFDISDACMGWCTGTDVAQGLLKNNSDGNVLIITSEFPMNENGSVLKDNFAIENMEQIDWKFPTLTLGEAATTTVLGSSDFDWEYDFISDSSNANLCVLPLYNSGGYANIDLDYLNPLQFAAFGEKLFRVGYRKSYKLLKNFLERHKGARPIVLPHSIASTVPNRVAELLGDGYQNKMYSTFVRTGNVATSSIPTNIYFCLESGLVQRGEHLVGWVASGGLKFSVFDIHL